MSISLLSHRLAFGNTDILPSDLESRMQTAFRQGVLLAEKLTALRPRAIEAKTRLLPTEFRANNYCESRALAAAYFHGVATKMIATRLHPMKRQEAKKIAAKVQRLILQLILSVAPRQIVRLRAPSLPGWKAAFVGALSVARVAYACRGLGFEVRYPRPVVDALHSVDLFCVVTPEQHLAIQVKTAGSSSATPVNVHAQDKCRQFFYGVLPLAKSAERRGLTILPVWALCSRNVHGLECDRLRNDFARIAGRFKKEQRDLKLS